MFASLRCPLETGEFTRRCWHIFCYDILLSVEMKRMTAFNRPTICVVCVLDKDKFLAIFRMSKVTILAFILSEWAASEFEERRAKMCCDSDKKVSASNPDNPKESPMKIQHMQCCARRRDLHARLGALHPGARDFGKHQHSLFHIVLC